MAESRGDRYVMTAIYILLGLVSLIVLYPIYFVLIASFSSPEEVMLGKVWLWPKNLSLVGYERIFENNELMRVTSTRLCTRSSAPL